jgi:hypothetical protein
MINRKEIVDRHSPRYKKINYNAPLSVGNGTFCFTADFTGLQTFFNDYSSAPDAFPLCTMAEWGWHSYPRHDDDKAKLRLTPYDTYGRTVYYASDDTGQEELFKRIRVNAHKFHLGKIGFEFSDNAFSRNDIKPVSQFLSLWEGILFSQFLIGGESVKTETFVHPDENSLYVRVVSPLLKDGKSRVTLVFPYGSHKKSAANFSALSSHVTRNRGNYIERELDGTSYKVILDGKSFTSSIDEKQHTVTLFPNSEEIEFSVKFEPLYVPVLDETGIIYKKNSKKADSFDIAKTKCGNFWENYWNSGGFIDFSGSTDCRARELERGITLSQYLVAIQSRGQFPPAETGLTCNSWYGKFHLEMYFWHHARLALWGRAGELKKSLAYYKKILPVAREIAASQGYSGARWPKMCDPSGRNTPSSIAVFLIWQEPHPVMLAELCRRAEPSDDFIREYREVVVQTAEFIKSFVHWEEESKRYALGPPYIPVQERHDPAKVLNAAFELEYFRWALRVSDEWLKKLGEPTRYGEIADKLSLPAMKDGVYIAHENCPDTFENFNTDHPSMLAMYGVLDSEKIDRACMSSTLDKVLEKWDMKTLYGWDFPMMAMTACRLGRYNDAVDILLMDSPKNTWLENGHNRMTGDDALPLYLPGNGSLLLAVAMMARGFGEKKGPFFPEGFNVKTEGLFPYI